MIVVNLDVMMAKRKMSLNELSEKVDISLANLSEDVLKGATHFRIAFTNTLNGELQQDRTFTLGSIRFVK